MPVFNINTEIFLGISHYGEEYAYGEGSVELTDEEVQQLVDFIRENGGETDVEALKLKEKLPDIYECLDEAYREAAFDAAYCHWVVEGYENGWYEVSTDEAIEKCKKYGFKFEYKEEDYYDEDLEDIDEDALDEARSEAFSTWVENYRAGLSSGEEATFLSDVFELEPEIDSVDYEVVIPEEITKLALSNQ